MGAVEAILSDPKIMGVYTQMHPLNQIAVNWQLAWNIKAHKWGYERNWPSGPMGRLHHPRVIKLKEGFAGLAHGRTHALASGHAVSPVALRVSMRAR